MSSKSRLHSNIHRLILSQALSKLGDNFTEVALALFVLAITHRNVAALGLVLAMAYVPRIALGWAVAGVIDRLPKRSTLLVSDIVRAVLVASLPVVHSYVWTLIAVFLMYAFAMVYQPILGGVQPQIAGDPSVNAQSAARQETYSAVADIGAYLAVGATLFLWGIAPAFWVDASTYLGAALLISAIRVDPALWASVRGGTRDFWRQIGEGFQHLKDHRLVAQLVLLTTALSMAVASLNTLLAPLSRDYWRVSSSHYVWLVLSMAVGNFVSGTVIERYHIMDRGVPRVLLATGFLLTAVGFGSVLLVNVWWWGLPGLGLVGVGNSLFGSVIMVWVQNATPDAVRTRVMAIRGIGLGFGGALGAAGGGFLGRVAGLGSAAPVVVALWLLLAAWTLASRVLNTPLAEGTAA